MECFYAHSKGNFSLELRCTESKQWYSTFLVFGVVVCATSGRVCAWIWGSGSVNRFINTIFYSTVLEPVNCISRDGVPSEMLVSHSELLRKCAAVDDVAE